MCYEPQRIFVYGTLQPGGTYWPQFCEGKVSEVHPAKARGELFDLHQGYPGARFGGTAWVQGCVMTVLTEQAFQKIDELEGYDLNREYLENEYTRLRVETYKLEGQSLGKVWAYEINAHYLQRFKGTVIADGIWPL